RIVTPSIIRPSPAERTSPITTTSAAPPPLWWVWDCAWVALMKPKFNKIKIVDSRNRVEENGAETVANRREIYSHSTISLSSCRTGTFFFSAKKKAKNSSLKNFETTGSASSCIFSKFCNATFLAGVRVAEVSVSLWDLLLKMFPSESSQARCETTDCTSSWFFSKLCNVALLAGVRVAEVSVSLWDLLLKMFPSVSSQARFETTGSASSFVFSKFCSTALLAGVRVADVYCLVVMAYIFERLMIAHGLKIANQSTLFSTSYRLEVADMELTFARLR